MKASSSENLQLVDQLAKTAHDMVDSMHDRAAKMEGEFSKQAEDTSEHFAAKIESRVNNLENMIADNPVMAAAIAFGLGAFGSRVFKSIDLTPSKTSPVESVPSEEKPKASAKKAA